MSAAQPGVQAVTERILLDFTGTELRRETISEDTYEALPQRNYVGAQER